MLEFLYNIVRDRWKNVSSQKSARFVCTAVYIEHRLIRQTQHRATTYRHAVKIELKYVTSNKCCWLWLMTSHVLYGPSIAENSVMLSIGDLTTGLAFWHCAHSMRSRVYKTVRCPSVRLSVNLSHQSNAVAACGGFATERRTRKRYRLTAPGSSSAAARGRSTALSSNGLSCWQPN